MCARGADGYLLACSPIRQMTASCYGLEPALCQRRPLQYRYRGGARGMLERHLYPRPHWGLFGGHLEAKRDAVEAGPAPFELKEEINRENPGAPLWVQHHGQPAKRLFLSGAALPCP